MARIENPEIAAVFAEMADLVQITGGDRHRIASFRRSARILEGLPEPAETMLKLGTLRKVHGIGDGTVYRVKQILRTGTCDDLRKLKSRLPPGLREMLKIKGVGPRTVRTLYQSLGISSVDMLEAAARSGRIQTLPRMGTGTVTRILNGIANYRRRVGRFPLIDAQRAGMDLVRGLRELPEALRVELAGSVRRRKASVGDLDILVSTDDPEPVVARFVTLPRVDEVLLHGTGRSSVRLTTGQQADLRLLPPTSFGAGLHYFTGSKLHNVHLRKLANLKGIKVSDKGIFTRPEERRISPGETEEEIFAAVGLPWIPPELREDQGEFDAAKTGRLPGLVRAEDLRGDLHLHTTASDGRGTIEEMVARARELGYEYLAITDHSQSLSIANGLDEARLAAQVQKIREVDAATPDIKVLAGVEVDILPDGSLDLDEGLLAQLDWVIGSVHLHTNLAEAEMTSRIVRAMESGLVDAVGHPTGRRPAKREAYALDLEDVLEAARRLDVALECNGGPNRMDLGDVQCRKARERGVPVVVNTDAHAPRHLGRMEFGLAMARRGWLEPQHVLNTYPWEVIAQRRKDRMRARGVAVPLGEFAPAPREEDHLADAELSVADEEDAHAWGDGEMEASEEALAAAEVDPNDVDALIDALHDEPRPQALAERIQAYLQSADADPTMAEALGRLSDNPLQLAFNLVMGASLPRVPPPEAD